MKIEDAAARGTLTEFMEVYEPGMASSWIGPDGSTLLTIALDNTENRLDLCDFLLDEGADASATVTPSGVNCLHVLIKHMRFGYLGDSPAHIDAMADVLQRLLDGGADINAVASDMGTPLQYFAKKMSNEREESRAIPFYIELFARPEIDLLTIGAFNESTYESIWKSPKAMIMLQYTQHYMRLNGIEIPDLPPISDATSVVDLP